MCVIIISEGDDLIAGKTISICQGKGSIAHNNRLFVPKNVDTERTKDNITFVCEPIGEAYGKLFDEAVKRYNSKQKRNDRKIMNGYFEYQFSHKVCNNVVTSADKRKSFYEDVIQIGTMTDTGVGTDDAEKSIRVLKKYAENFGARNPNMYVFNCVLHLDEKTPHLHLDYIPVGHYKRGVDTQNGLAQALSEMGFGKDKQAIARWRQSEYEYLRSLCISEGIEVAEPKKSRGISFAVDEYKEYRRKLDALEEKIKPLENIELSVDSAEIPYKKAFMKKDSFIISGDELKKVNSEKKAAIVRKIEAENEIEANRLQTQRIISKNEDIRRELESERDRINRENEEQVRERAEIDNMRSELVESQSETAEKNRLLDEKIREYREKYNTQTELNKRYEELSEELQKSKEANNNRLLLIFENNRLRGEVNMLKKQSEQEKEKYDKLLADKERSFAAERENIKKSSDDEKDELNGKISELNDTISDMKTQLDEFKRESEINDALYDDLRSISKAAFDRLGMDFERALNMKINGYRTSYIFGDDGYYR